MGGSQRDLDYILTPPTKVFFFSLQRETSHNKIRESGRDRGETEIENNGVWRRKQEREKPKKKCLFPCIKKDKRI